MHFSFAKINSKFKSSNWCDCYHRCYIILQVITDRKNQGAFYFEFLITSILYYDFSQLHSSQISYFPIDAKYLDIIFVQRKTSKNNLIILKVPKSCSQNFLPTQNSISIISFAQNIKLHVLDLYLHKGQIYIPGRMLRS